MLMDGSDAEVAPGVKLPRSALGLSFSRASGPGGQHVNKANTRVTLTVQLAALRQVMGVEAYQRLERLAGRYLAGEHLAISAGHSRSQLANRRACFARLRALLVEASHRPRARKATRPTRASVRRRLDAKRARAARKAERRESRRPGEG